MNNLGRGSTADKLDQLDLTRSSSNESAEKSTTRNSSSGGRRSVNASVSAFAVVEILDSDDDEQKENEEDNDKVVLEIPPRAAKRQRRVSTGTGDATNNANNTKQVALDAAIARRWQAQEDLALEQRKQQEEEAMHRGTSGRAFLLVQKVLAAFQEVLQEESSTDVHWKSLVQAVGKDDMVFLAEKMMQCQADFTTSTTSACGSSVEIAYHYTHQERLDSIRQDGLLSRTQIASNTNFQARHGAAFGEGVYVGNNPYAFRSYGDTGLLVAILKGNAATITDRSQIASLSPTVNTVIANKFQINRPQHSAGMDEMVLRDSRQVLPLIRFNKELIGDSCTLDHAGNALLFKLHIKMQQLIHTLFQSNNNSNNNNQKVPVLPTDFVQPSTHAMQWLSQQMAIRTRARLPVPRARRSSRAQQFSTPLGLAPPQPTMMSASNQALAKIVEWASKNPSGPIDPELLKAAQATGMSCNTIELSVQIARQRQLARNRRSSRRIPRASAIQAQVLMQTAQSSNPVGLSAPTVPAGAPQPTKMSAAAMNTTPNRKRHHPTITQNPTPAAPPAAPPQAQFQFPQATQMPVATATPAGAPQPVKMSAAAKQALANVVDWASKNPLGPIDPELLQAAEATWLLRANIEQAVQVARQRRTSRNTRRRIARASSIQAQVLMQAVPQSSNPVFPPANNKTPNRKRPHPTTQSAAPTQPQFPQTTQSAAPTQPQFPQTMPAAANNGAINSRFSRTSARKRAKAQTSVIPQQLIRTVTAPPPTTTITGQPQARTQTHQSPRAAPYASATGPPNATASAAANASTNIGSSAGLYSVLGTIPYHAPATLPSNQDNFARIRCLGDTSEECLLCHESLRVKGRSVRLIGCGHKFHHGCLVAVSNKDSANALRCPNCLVPTGEPQGKCPSGTMKVSSDMQQKLCVSHEQNSFGTYTITYTLPVGVQQVYHDNPGQLYAATERQAYLPQNEQGDKLLRRLKYAWTKGLVFKIGTSVTSGKSGVITWASIPHKSSLKGGAFGFPDPNYFDTCNRALDDLCVPSADLLYPNGSKKDDTALARRNG
ncbi:Probable E3 ubiquitin-protein ligase DTX2 [Seminavis robusta]|uniref:RING-type E3 ubiquitin transferase n=1 Tax=Seminavis robusta TaxID=568900 RepID=A0A9N8DG45_9STRA|nr:Probable E3 ubiquitin-protein ligase DTX2 [Seminavis robusta]|eukprot:Sro76_g041540.1 Probable E3 ubiquitin-protein ligase DTX2 (1059) ;mRNA; f:28226-31402